MPIMSESEAVLTDLVVFFFAAGDSLGVTGVVPNSDPCQIIIPLVLVGLGLGVGEGLGLGVGLGLGNHIAISRRGVANTV